MPIKAEHPSKSQQRKNRRDALVLQYLPLARAMAYRVTSLPFEDAVQEATIGLLRAVDHFDESRNTAFSTYARYWITEALQKAAIQSLPVHVPLHVAKASLAKSRRGERAANGPADGNCLAGGSHANGSPANDCAANDLFVDGLPPVRQPASESPADKAPLVSIGDSPQRPRRTGDRRVDHAFAKTNIRAVRAEMENAEGDPLHGDALTQNPWTATDIRMDADTVIAMIAGLSSRQEKALSISVSADMADMMVTHWMKPETPWGSAVRP
ncbi:RNA polymerase sigma-70 factor family protein [Acidithiobacillus sp. GGI-221]|nr:RNA polymerase sigma-70 factor family protein [Acidithiobacillus sp. GGI-221]